MRKNLTSVEDVVLNQTCANCKLEVRDYSFNECVGCGADLTKKDAVLGFNESIYLARIKDKKIDQWAFVFGVVFMTWLLAFLLMPPSWNPWSLSIGRLFLAFCAGLIIYHKMSRRISICLIYCIPQILLCGISPGLWTCYVMVGMVIGIWKESQKYLS